MGRAQGNTPAAATGKQAGLASMQRGSHHHSRRRFNVVVALHTFNEAASQRAALATIIEDLAHDASERALSVHSAMLKDFSTEAIGEDITDGEHRQTLQDSVHFNLHTELRVALDEGRRLQETTVDGLASSAVRSSLAGILAERLYSDDDTLTSAQWYEMLSKALAESDPKTAWKSVSLQRSLLADLPE